MIDGDITIDTLYFFLLYVCEFYSIENVSTYPIPNSTSHFIAKTL